MELRLDFLEKIKLSNREVALVSAVLIAFPFAYRQTVLRQQKASLQVLNEQINQFQNEIATKERIKADFEAAQGKIESSNDKNLHISAEMLKEYSEANRKFASVIQSISDEDGRDFLKVNKIETKETVTEGSLVRTKIALALDSPFVELGKFLEKIETSKMLASVASVKISRISDELKRCSATVEMNAYVAKK